MLILAGFLVLTLLLKRKFKIKDDKITLIWIVIIALTGIVWDYFAAWRGHWIFPGPGLIGLRIGSIPIEEYFFVTITPYFAITVYRILLKAKILNKRH